MALTIMLAAMNMNAATPKREFRGVWIPTVGDRYFQQHNTQENKAYLLSMLDSLQLMGCNAVIFHVRPQSDAFYKSELEPWSKWVTGKQGVPPDDPTWDPLTMMVDESHKRGMELHAWINPYRVGWRDQLCPEHPYFKHPERFVEYNTQLYFDPAYKENRDFINKVVKDIVTRYDIDALHMDDFFYPYPKNGLEFMDTTSYEKLGRSKGWGDLADWRRHNVNMLIREMHDTIKAAKPWVRYGISPYGIWRNKKNDVNGSNTDERECYGTLFADCLLWTEQGWLDYLIPQLYWELENEKTGVLELSHWWNRHTNGRHMYYGLFVDNTMDFKDIDDTSNPTQLDHKMRLIRELENVAGVTWWPGSSLLQNYKGIADSLINKQQAAHALVPQYPWIDDTAPDPVVDLRQERKADAVEISWTAPPADDPMQQTVKYVIYRFGKDEPVDLDNAGKIVAVTSDTHYRLPLAKKARKAKAILVVTALDRVNNESAGRQVEVTL